MARNDQKNIILICGTTGLGLEKIAKTFLRFRGDKTYVHIDLERKLENELGQSIIDILDNIIRTPDFYTRRYNTALEKIIKDLHKEENILISTHLSYMRRRHIFPNPAIFRIFRDTNLHVNKLIYIVDDYYHVIKRIADRQDGRSTVDEVIDPISYLQWRANDFGVALSLLYNGIDVLLFALKHRKELFRRLATHVFSPEKKKMIYIAHHISEPRRQYNNSVYKEGGSLVEIEEVKEIEEFKERLINNCEDIILLNPTTIDEYIYDNENKLLLDIDRHVRWPHSDDTLLEYTYPISLDLVALDSKLFPKDALKEERYLEQLSDMIKLQIGTRDLFYVNQADIVLAYRPTMYGKASRGVMFELSTAAALGKTTYAFIENNEEFEAFPRLFGSYMARRVNKFESLLNILDCN